MFLSHLIELRKRLIYIVVVFLVSFLILMQWSNEIYLWVAMPILSAFPQQQTMIATEVMAPFFIPVKVTLWASFLLTLPNSLYHVWRFVSPAMYQNEKKWFLSLLSTSLVLFFTGMLFTYFFVLPAIFEFLVWVTPTGMTMMTDVGAYLSFVLGLFLVFGFSFELPIVVVLLKKMGVVTITQLKTARSYVIVGIFVASAILTPPDVLSQLLLAIPLCLLYEVGIVLSKYVGDADE